MSKINFIIEGRGFRNAFHRAQSVKRRFGMDPTRFLKQVELFARLTEQYGTRPSFPISTILLRRYPSIGRELRTLPLDLLSHGYTHIDYAKITRAEQQRLVQRSKVILSAEGFETDGFRAPYLHWNEDLLETVLQNGFMFDSSAVHWCLPASAFALNSKQQKTYLRAYRFYEPFYARPNDGSHPYFLANGLLEIPVTLPDDEILIDRLNVTDASRLSELLLAVFERSYELEGLFNLQLHPERIVVMKEALEALLRASHLQSPPVWLASLRDINRWWREKDRFKIHWEIVENGISIRLGDVERHTVLIKTFEEVKGTVAWKGPFTRITQREVRLPGKHVPLVGLSGEGKALKPMLTRLGYLFAETKSGCPFALTFSHRVHLKDILKAIEECRHPLLRVAPWPNGCRSAVCISGDIDCMTIQDFVWRFVEKTSSE